MKYRVNYHTDEDIADLAMLIIRKTDKLKPDYLKIDGLAHEIIKYCKQGMRCDENH